MIVNGASVVASETADDRVSGSVLRGCAADGGWALGYLKSPQAPDPASIRTLSAFVQGYEISLAIPFVELARATDLVRAADHL